MKHEKRENLESLILTVTVEGTWRCLAQGQEASTDCSKELRNCHKEETYFFGDAAEHRFRTMNFLKKKKNLCLNVRFNFLVLTVLLRDNSYIIVTNSSRKSRS